MFWVDHLEMMDYMRSSVNLRAYGQRDPLVEYKREGLRLFRDMQISIIDQIIKLLAIIDTQSLQNVPVEMNDVKNQAKLILNDNSSAPAKVSEKAEVGRNDACPCGSGKKYKKCHGK